MVKKWGLRASGARGRRGGNVWERGDGQGPPRGQRPRGRGGQLWGPERSLELKGGLRKLPAGRWGGPGAAAQGAALSRRVSTARSTSRAEAGGEWGAFSPLPTHVRPSLCKTGPGASGHCHPPLASGLMAPPEGAQPSQVPPDLLPRPSTPLGGLMSPLLNTCPRSGCAGWGWPGGGLLRRR